MGRPASVVEYPCGHLNVCTECHQDYRSNMRCLRCRGAVPLRLDLSPFLDEVTGRPSECRMCKSQLASVVMMPCVHMSFCAGCLPKTIAGCPSCGQRVEQTCVVLWATAERIVGGLRSFPGLPASARERHRPQMRSDGLERATEDVDEEIARLEQQLRQLRGHTVPGQKADG